MWLLGALHCHLCSLPAPQSLAKALFVPGATIQRRQSLCRMMTMRWMGGDPVLTLPPPTGGEGLATRTHLDHAWVATAIPMALHLSLFLGSLLYELQPRRPQSPDAPPLGGYSTAWLTWGVQARQKEQGATCLSKVQPPTGPTMEPAAWHPVAIWRQTGRKPKLRGH